MVKVHKRWVAAGVAVLVVAIIAASYLYRSAHQPIATIRPAMETLPSAHGFSVPVVSGLAWDIKSKIYGYPPTVLLQLRIAEYSPLADEQRTTLGAPDATNHEGAELWIVDQAKLDQLEQTLTPSNKTHFAWPDVHTTAGMQSVLSMRDLHDPEWKAQIEFIPTLEHKAVRVATLFRVVEVTTNEVSPTIIDTNIDLTATVRIPEGSGMFISQSPQRTRAGCAIILKDVRLRRD